MSKDQFQGMDDAAEKKAKKTEMSRRQFLSYTLGGTGGFLASMVLIPNLRFAVDPILKKKTGSDWVKVVEESKITDTPQSFKFKKHVIDGWYESDQKIEAFIARGEDGKIFALSPICQHLGCSIGWAPKGKAQDEFFCPCHEARYTKDGKNLAVAPRPLKEYAVKVDQGWVYLGQLGDNMRV